MQPSSSAFLRDAGICVLAALLSLGVGLVVGRRSEPPLPQSQSASTNAAVRTPLSLVEFRAAVDAGEALVIDARDDISYARGHVPRALSLPERRFDARFPQLRALIEADFARHIIVYCANVHCGASSEVQARLHELGYTNVTVFPDGWSAWKNAGYPEEKSAATARAPAPWKNPS